MALFMSTMLSAVSGSVNGTVYSKNRYGAYMRNKTIPVNPHSDPQSLVRGAFSQGSAAWRGLTQDQRDAWSTYAGTVVSHNRLGQVITLSGIAIFVRTNFYVQYTGNSIITTAPPAGTLPLPSENLYGMVDSAANQITPQYTPAFVAGQRVIRWISPPQSKGIKFYNGPWIPLPTVDGADAEDVLDMETLVPGYNYSNSDINFFVRLVYVDANWRVSEKLITGPYTGVTAI